MKEKKHREQFLSEDKNQWKSQITTYIYEKYFEWIS